MGTYLCNIFTLRNPVNTNIQKASNYNSIYKYNHVNQNYLGGHRGCPFLYSFIANFNSAILINPIFSRINIHSYGISVGNGIGVKPGASHVLP